MHLFAIAMYIVVMSQPSCQKIGKDELLEAVSCFGQVFSCGFCVHPYTALARRVFGDIPFYHRNNVCRELKRLDGDIPRCSQFDGRYVRGHLKNSCGLFFKRCHWGLAELVIPISLRGSLMGSFFAGPFRMAPGVVLEGQLSSTPTPVARSRGSLMGALPALDKKKAKAMAVFGKMLGWRLNSFLAQEAERQEAGACPTRRRMIEDCLDGNLGNPGFCLDDLATRLGLSRAHTSRLVLKTCGRGFAELLMGKRMEAVAKLLANTEYPVRSIAGMAGFTSSEYLHRVFRRHFGVTPKEYRCQEPAKHAKKRGVGG